MLTWLVAFNNPVFFGNALGSLKPAATHLWEKDWLQKGFRNLIKGSHEIFVILPHKLHVEKETHLLKVLSSQMPSIRTTYTSIAAAVVAFAASPLSPGL